jgi:hypothetical protein
MQTIGFALPASEPPLAGAWALRFAGRALRSRDAGCSDYGSTSNWTVERRRTPRLPRCELLDGRGRALLHRGDRSLQSMLRSGGRRVRGAGPLGQFQAGGATCIPADPSAHSPPGATVDRARVRPLPSSRPTTLEYQVGTFAMVRGMIPLLGLITGGMGDTSSLLPKSATLPGAIPAGVGDSVPCGPRCLRAPRQPGQCVVAGLIQPIGER